MAKPSPSPSAKLEPRLAQELAAARATGSMSKPVPVIIELATPLRIGAVSRRPQTIESVERRGHRLQRKLVARLIELGARHIQQVSLVNAVSAELRPTQIPLIAAHPDVRIVRLARREQVTTA